MGLAVDVVGAGNTVGAEGVEVVGGWVLRNEAVLVAMAPRVFGPRKVCRPEPVSIAVAPGVDPTIGRW
jgi:hypothetical protein